MMEDDPRFDPPIRSYEDVSGLWVWVAGVAGLLVLGFVIFTTLNDNSNTASSGSSPPSTRTATPPSTTGSGPSSPQPITPAPSKLH